MKIAVVTPTMKSGEQGGAEMLYEGLVRSLRQEHETDQVEVTVDESSFEAILESYFRCAQLDLSAYDLVVSTKAPTYMVRHPNHVSYLLHTIRVFYDMFAREYGEGSPEQREQQRTVQALDRFALDPARIRKHLANGNETFLRIQRVHPFWKQVPFQAIHHPPTLAGFHEPRPGKHIFLPSRLHRWKRADLVIKAFQHVKSDIPLKIAGTGEDEGMLRELAAGDPRVQFLGRVSNAEVLDLYADAIAVPFVPVMEDYGLVTIEAFLSKKPVITCTDSGEPCYFVKDFETGFVAEPHPAAIAEKIEYLAHHSLEAAAMGRAGFEKTRGISWDRIVETIVGHAPVRHTTTTHGRNGSAGPAAATAPTQRVLVLDMQPIDPATGGGRMRLLGLYHGLGDNLPTTYVGTYDWPGPTYRRHKLTDTLEEIDVPLSPAHFAAANELQEKTGGKGVIDVAFPALVHHSPDFVREVREQLRSADIVVFSHPWIYPIVQHDLRRESQLVVYESHNVEGFLRCVLLDDGGGNGTALVKEVARIERELCHAADIVLACSQEDRLLFHELYGVPLAKIVIAPNGTFTRGVKVATPEARQQMKQQLGLPPGPAGIFLGSAYGPNLEAAEFINDKLAPALPQVIFLICGDVGDALKKSGAPISLNVRTPGRLTDEEKANYLAACDLAVNPMFSGSGTNVKMFDFMAAGLPVVTTPTGARGIMQADSTLRTVEPEQFISSIEEIVGHAARAQQLGAAARKLVEEKYSWERISAGLGALLRRHRDRLNQPKPLFSVVVATYERHERLVGLLDSLRMQSFKNFEVILVDQSARRWNPTEAETAGLDLFYVHTDIKGAVNARNTGVFYARGDVIAFTDDDCLPLFNWLECASRYFDDPTVVGIEGIIMSDKWDDPDFRAVTNIGLRGEGFMTEGFMTANFFIRRAIFHAIDGFDERFDHPHFREDTDLGWRAQAYGRLPFGQDVCIYHPPQPRQVEREGLAERNKFFEKDALLLKKHPQRYKSLFLKEAHYAQTVGFREHFLRGAEKYGVEIDEYFRSMLAV